jgi:hypothetical protein
MRVGQRVMLIAPLDTDYIKPPVGSIGVITVGIDEFQEYEVSFDGFPHPAINDPDWIVHKNWIIPIDDDKKETIVYEEESLYA